MLHDQVTVGTVPQYPMFNKNSNYIHSDFEGEEQEKSTARLNSFIEGAKIRNSSRIDTDTNYLPHQALS